MSLPQNDFVIFGGFIADTLRMFLVSLQSINLHHFKAYRGHTIELSLYNSMGHTNKYIELCYCLCISANIMGIHGSRATRVFYRSGLL